MQLCLFIAKFHYTDTDPNGPARTQRSFAAKKVRVRVGVVEFSYYETDGRMEVGVGTVASQPVGRSVGGVLKSRLINRRRRNASGTADEARHSAVC